MGKLTISMAMFNSFLYVYQRVHHVSAESSRTGPYLWIFYGPILPNIHDSGQIIIIHKPEMFGHLG